MTSATFDSASTTSTKRVRNLPLRAVKELESSLSSRQDAQACDATCLSASYQGIGALTAEIAYTVKACVAKNAVGKSQSKSSTYVVRSCHTRRHTPPHITTR